MNVCQCTNHLDVLHHIVACLACGETHLSNCSNVASVNSLNWICTTCSKIAPDDRRTPHGGSAGKHLDLFSSPEDERPLLNNKDRDPDEHYFSTHFANCRYNTPANIRLEHNAARFTFMHINCRSILHKLLDIETLLYQFNIDVLALTETWLDSVSAENIKIRGYTFLHKCRETNRWGGVGFLVKQDISHALLDLPHLAPSTSSFESLFLFLPQKKGPNFILGSVYRPPGQNLITFNDEFNLILSELCKKYKIIHLAGDFNIDLLKYQSHNLTNQFVNCIAAHHLLPTITRPTRITATTSTLIDNIFTSTPANVLDSLMVVTDVSDHLPILINLDLAPSWIHGTNSSLVRNINDSSMKVFKSLIEQIDWSSTSTLIDNIFTSTPANVLDSLIVVTDVSDHLPILINLDLAPSWIHGTNSPLVRNINFSSMKVFKSLIEQID